MKNKYALSVFNKIKKSNLDNLEYLQVIEEFIESIDDYLEDNSFIEKENLLERLLIPNRFIEFKVTWLDDNNNIQVNKGYRVQYNNSLGIYKGGLRFHPSLNESIIKSLGFEQCIKNSLTLLPIGGAKGGSNFDPKGKSKYEIMRFCQAFMNELYKYIGSEIDVPAGDIGVNEEIIGYLYGQYKKLTDEHKGVLTGKSIIQSGSLLRKEATGYGLVYFTSYALEKLLNITFKGKTVVISGSGNVAIYSLEKCLELGAKVVSISDSNGYVYNPNGIKLELVKEIKEKRKGRIKEYLELDKETLYFDNNNSSIWSIKCDIALPCATQNEITIEDAKLLVNNGVLGVFEGSNIASTNEAIKYFLDNKIIYGPSKAVNSGGVIVSYYEMSQNAMKLNFTKEEVNKLLKERMEIIFNSIYEFNLENKIEYYNLLKASNILGFKRIIDAINKDGVV